jgi:hypothetical protein
MPIYPTKKVPIDPTRDLILPKLAKFHLEHPFLKRTNTLMKNIGLDLGTKHIVLAWRSQDNVIKTTCEVNGYITLPRADAFTEQLLLKSAVPYIVKGEGNSRELIAIGGKAEQLAYAFNKTLCRPMAEGAVSKFDEDAQEIIAIIIKSIIGKLTENALIYYCTAAKPINSDMNMDFHKKIVKLIIESYATDQTKVRAFHINEARCLILEEQVEAIGISWGAGTATVHAGIFGVPIFEYSIVGVGDWIDIEVAKRFGYDPEHPDRNFIETPTSVCRRKESMSLLKLPEDRVGQAIYLMYEILIENVVNGMIRGFKENRDKFRFDKPIPIINAGGSCMPEGFMELLKRKLNEMKDKIILPIGELRKVPHPLTAVARGCLLAAEAHKD